jgi:uncharacterized protein DUF3850
MTHTLYVVEGLYQLLESGRKTFLCIKDDRNYIVGDTIAFQYLPNRKELKMEVAYLEVEISGLKKDYIILGLKPEIVG